MAGSSGAALKQVAEVRDGRAGGAGGCCGLFEQTASANKCGQGSTAAFTEVVGGIKEVVAKERKRWSAVSAPASLTLPLQRGSVWLSD